MNFIAIEKLKALKNRKTFLTGDFLTKFFDSLAGQMLTKSSKSEDGFFKSLLCLNDRNLFIRISKRKKIIKLHFVLVKILQKHLLKR